MLAVDWINLDFGALTLLSFVLFATAIMWWIDIKLRPVPGVMACPLLVTGPIWAGIVAGLLLWGPALLEGALVWMLLALIFAILCWSTFGLESPPHENDVAEKSNGVQG